MGKTLVHCDLTDCMYCRKRGVTDFVCGCDEIEFFGEECITYGAYVDSSEEYSETFWKRIRSRADLHECRQECHHGKRYEMIGLIWFTDQDDRWGTDEVWFTEQRSGIKCKGMDIKKKNAEKIRERIGSIPPVTELPEMTLEDL